MAILKINALQRLRDVIASEIKELKGNICAGPGTQDHKEVFPSLAIVPIRFSFYPDQADEHDYISGANAVEANGLTYFNVGRWEGTLELRLGEKTPFKRYEFEHRIEQIFLGNVTGTGPDYVDQGRDMRPGILLVDVPECKARCAFELEDDAWENEKVFSNKWYSVLRINAVLPALVEAKSPPLIENLYLSLTHDLETDASLLSDEDTETVVITEGDTTGGTAEFPSITTGALVRSFQFTVPSDGTSWAVSIPSPAMPDTSYAAAAFVTSVPSGGNLAILQVPNANKGTTTLTIDSSGTLLTGTIIDVILTDF